MSRRSAPPGERKPFTISSVVPPPRNRSKFTLSRGRKAASYWLPPERKSVGPWPSALSPGLWGQWEKGKSGYLQELRDFAKMALVVIFITK
jgi:hypothetical protein